LQELKYAVAIVDTNISKFNKLFQQENDGKKYRENTWCFW
jgi:hypothetical protein